MVRRITTHPNRVVQPAVRVAPVPPAERAAGLTSFEVTSDSVAATAVLRYEAHHSQVRVVWGDGHVDRVDLGRQRRLQLAIDGSASGTLTLRLQHIYDVKSLLGQYKVIAITRDDAGRTAMDVASVKIRPRYRITQDPIQVELSNPLDLFDNVSEVDIHLVIHQRGVEEDLLDRSWRLNADIGDNNIFGRLLYELEDSGFAWEMDWDEGAVEYWFPEITDVDGWWGVVKDIAEHTWDFLTPPNEFDFSAVFGQLGVHPKNFDPDGSMTWRFYSDVRDGRVYITVKWWETLVVPRDRPVPVVALL